MTLNQAIAAAKEYATQSDTEVWIVREEWVLPTQETPIKWLSLIDGRPYLIDGKRKIMALGTGRGDGWSILTKNGVYVPDSGEFPGTQQDDVMGIDEDEAGDEFE